MDGGLFFQYVELRRKPFTTMTKEDWVALDACIKILPKSIREEVTKEGGKRIDQDGIDRIVTKILTRQLP